MVNKLGLCFAENMEKYLRPIDVMRVKYYTGAYLKKNPEPHAGVLSRIMFDFVMLDVLIHIVNNEEPILDYSGKRKKRK